MVYGGARPAALNQGDILKDVPFLIRHGENTDAWRGYPLLGLITSHSCDFTKFAETEHALSTMQAEVWPLRVAPVYHLSEVEADQRHLAMSGSVYRYFPMPADRGEGDFVADLAFEQPLPVTVLRTLPLFDRLSDEFLDRLQGQIVLFKTRIDLVELDARMEDLRVENDELRHENEQLRRQHDPGSA